MLRSMRAENRARKLIRATETDELTGLYNRSYFFQYIDRMHKEHPDKPCDALVVDIDQFRSVNALSGRESGDRILRALADEIRAFAEENGGIAGRSGADRFDIYCRHREDFQAVFDRLQARLDSLAPGAGIRLRMGVMPWQDRLEAAEQFEKAATACGMARGHFKEHLVIYDENVGRIEQQNQRLLNDLRRALDSYEFQVYYQPKYDIQADPPALAGAEALVRWQHPELGMLLPDAFVPLFERSGKIGDVDKYVWAEAARKIARWRVEFGLTIPVSVNLSRADLSDPELEKTLDDILSGNGLSHDALRLEVTESAYSENDDRVVLAVKNLRGRGYRVEMDDFGTGCSSLNMLSSMPVDGLKMDRNFIRNIGENKGDIQLAALIIGAAKKLNIPVTAVGVETESQLKILKDLGCELVQGFVFSRPLPPADFESDVISKAI